LVTGQSTGSQNGLYYLPTLGSGANGTWARTSDGNENGEIEAGMIVMVTEGTIYADTQWKLITDDPIVINTTALTFTQNYMANSISSGTSNVVVNSNANVTISSAGTANVLTVSSTGTVTTGTASVTGNVTGGNVLTAGLISASGNITGDYFLGNVFFANGITASKIYSGNSEVNVTSSGGNVNVSIGGTSNVAVFATTGEYITGLLSASGNITGGNLLTAGLISGTGNIRGSNILTSGIVSATGNVSGASLIGNVFSPAQVVINAAGQSEGAQIVMAWANVGNLTGQGNGSWNMDVDSSNTFRTFYQNTTGVTNVVFALNSTTQTANFSGNIGANYYYGNGAFLTGISGGGGGGGTSIANGATSITIPVSSGNIAMSVGGQSNTVVINLGSFTMYGTFAGPRTLSANVTVAPAVNALLLGPVTIDDGYNISVPNDSSVSAYTDESPNIVGTTVVVSGNISGGNILTAGLISAFGNITGFNILTSGLISATADITGGNILTAGLISAAGNITGNNIFTSGSILPTANATANIGNSSFQYNTIFAKATSAQYADLAERYEADATYEPGTVLCFGGSKEVTVCDVEDCTRVAGVVSTNPSYLMNSGQTGAHVASLALQGRVPTHVTGQVRKGDLMVSAGNGRAKTNNQARAGTIIGKALADSEGDTVIEVVIGRD
jgi:hypothetical protein